MKKYKVFIQYEKVEEVDTKTEEEAIKIARHKQEIESNETFVGARAEEINKLT